MRRHPLVSASLRETRFLCLSLTISRERRNPAAWTCNKSAVTTTPAAYPLRPIRYYLPTFIPSHPPPDRPTDQQRTASKCPKENPPDQTSSSSSTYPSHREPMQDPPIASVTYLPDFSPSDTRDLPDPTLSHLISPFFWIPPKKKENFLTAPSIYPSIHPRGPVPSSSAHDIQETARKALLPPLT